MMGKKIWTFDGSKYSPWHVLETANAYYALSKVFTSKLPPHGAVEEPDMHESVASATNRILALELYMKAILVGCPRDVPKTHDLVILFNALPEQMRTHFVRKFDEVTEAHPSQIRMRIESSFQLSYEIQDIEISEECEVFDPSLEALLERNKGGFEASRYLFQTAEWSKVQVYDYEYPRLALICSIMCETLESELQNRPHTYQRAFNF
jgi:hypothetical protein